MKQGIKYGLAFSLALPLGCAVGSDQLKDDMANTFRSLEAITSKADEAPALLLLTPSQLDALRQPVEREVTKPAKRPSSKKTTAPSSAPVAELKTLQATINRLNGTISQQEQELKQLRQVAQQDADARAEIDQLKQNLQDNLQATEQMQQDLAAASAVKAENSQNNSKLQQALDKSQQQSSALQKQLDALAKSHDDNNQENKALQAALNETRKQNESLQSQLAAQKRETIEPKSKREIRDYAIGSALAEEMLILLKERVAQGIDVDNRLALAGVQDTFAGKLKLQKQQIDTALEATEAALRQNEQQQIQNTKAAGKRYIDQFAKQKQVKKEALGYFYRIDKPGKGPIGANSMISVVVKESLINGKVVKDMATAETSITQLLSSYPPIFRTALAKLQNHGSITMVVPPTLAYGDKGLPPDIPPGSTMIYNVRILDVAQSATPAK